MSQDESHPNETRPAEKRRLRPFQFSPRLLLVATVLFGVAFGVLKWANVGTTALLVTLAVLAVAFLLAIGFTLVIARSVHAEDFRDDPE